MARRKLIWARMSPAMTTLTGISGAAGGMIESQDLLTSFRTQAGITRGPVGITVMRVRLMFQWHWPTTAGTDDSIAGNPIFYGVRPVPFQDLVLRDATEVITRGPQVSNHDDWMAWGMLPIKDVKTASTGLAATGSAGWAEVDVRSMRKLDELDETLELCVQATASTAPATLPMVVTSSVLLALP